MISEPYLPSNWLSYLRKSDDGLLKHCRLDVFKATGRGGQKRNKTANAIRLSLATLSVTDASSRSRSVNLKQAIRKMRLAIALDVTNVSLYRSNFKQFPEEVIPYVQGGLVRINPSNSVFPIFIGTFIDLYIKHCGDWPQIANQYQTSPSQLRKFVGKQGFFKTALDRLDRQLLVDDRRDQES